MKRRLIHYLGPVASLIILGAAVAVLYQEFQTYRLEDVARQLGASRRCA